MASYSSIHEFSSKFKGGVRANLFNCRISTPNKGQLADFEFHCKGTSLPASTIGNIDVPYRGRQLKVPGDRTFADWTVTVFNDKGMFIRGVFEEWMARMQDHWTNKADPKMSPYGKASVTQLDRSGETERTYNITSLYPTEVAAIDVAWDSNDAVEEYAVTFAVNHWVAGNGPVTTADGSNPEWGVQVRADSSGNVGADVWASITKSFA
jgi:hypothetical protein